MHIMEFVHVSVCYNQGSLLHLLHQPFTPHCIDPWLQQQRLA